MVRHPGRRGWRGLGAFALLVAACLVGSSVIVPAAWADWTLGSCVLPASPTPTHHAECSGDSLGTPAGSFDFDYAALDRTTFGTTSRPNLSSSTFVHANATDAVWAGVAFLTTDFTNATLDGIDLYSAVETGATFAGAHIVGANLRYGVWGGASFAGADLTGSDLTGGQFGSATNPTDFTNATLTGTVYTSTNLVPSNVTATATGPTGAAVTWPAPASETGEHPGPCHDAAGPVSSGDVFAIGITTVTCEVVDTATRTHGTGTFRVDVTGAAPRFTSGSSGTLVEGQPGSIPIRTTGFPATITEKGTLPPGVTFVDNHDGTARLTGTPAATGTYPITLTDANTAGAASQTFTLLVVAPPRITGTLPGGTVGVAYRATLTAAGGTPPYTWSIASGALPPGLALSAAGTVSGTPTTAGTYRVTVRVDDPASTAVTIVIVIGAPAAATPSAPAATVAPPAPAAGGNTTLASTGTDTAGLLTAATLLLLLGGGLLGVAARYRTRGRRVVR